MSNSFAQPCAFCQEAPVQGELWTPDATAPLCRECLLLAAAYDFLLDNVRKRRYSQAELRECAIYILDRIGARLKTDTAAFREELAEAGLKI